MKNGNQIAIITAQEKNISNKISHSNLNDDFTNGSEVYNALHSERDITADRDRNYQGNKSYDGTGTGQENV